MEDEAGADPREGGSVRVAVSNDSIATKFTLDDVFENCGIQDGLAVAVVECL